MTLSAIYLFVPMIVLAAMGCRDYLCSATPSQCLGKWQRLRGLR